MPLNLPCVEPWLPHVLTRLSGGSRSPGVAHAPPGRVAMVARTEMARTVGRSALRITNIGMGVPSGTAALKRSFPEDRTRIHVPADLEGDGVGGAVWKGDATVVAL